ncbi:hypothetical protein TVAG_464940 [Trichomonas vaginalis G3]|uniref:Uncharacterized protein n=1 Tax=Trichomonas vaginalis (strain ATCC PRA-98 / G3) TaxID=412133 RepID=A2DTV9_TRIV3|nr:hypothetical protein TVAGG3_0719340 [Trichomonas vaginalis G3]EAY16106.1 hypothetical protein TVAG_464940 [Trichomonas vaginalis G3]KAI5510479.1 hypothetical protein TVAGG3_0719340 [Trichomonas vaginalis G3]|eukprot:XP_001328329.1 hypothetical protein [Trichomonas vaginalis G3]
MFLYLALVENYLDSHRHIYKIPEAVSNSYSETDHPYEFNLLETRPRSGDYNTADLNSLVDTISRDFEIDRDKVQNYFDRCRWAAYAKQLFNKIQFNAQAK